MGHPFPSREPAMDTCDWKYQLAPDARGRIVNKIFETLKKKLPFSGPEGLNELRRIATKFEDRIFNCASSQTDYLRQISMKMLTMESGSQNAGGSSLPIPAANNGTSMNTGEPSENPGHWRTQMPPDSRQKNADKIMETLKKHVPNSGQEGLNELMRIAVSFEELIFNTTINQVDYFSKISFKIVEEGD